MPVCGYEKRVKSGAVMCSFAVILFAIRYFLPTEVLYISTISTAFKYYLFFNIGFYGQEWLQRKNMAGVWVSVSFILIYVLSDFEISWIGSNVLFVISGLCGTYVVLQLAQMNIPKDINKVLTHAGQNTLVIYGTHHILYAAIGVLLGVENFATTPLLTGVFILVVVAVLEIPTIYVINRWLPFLAGKRKKKVKTT